MKRQTKVNFFIALFNGILFGVLFTIAGGLIKSGSVDWVNFVSTVLFGVLVGTIVGMVIPAGRIGSHFASRISQPGQILYRFILYSVIMITMLLFMSPALNLFIGSFLHKVPIAVVLPDSYSLFLPFYLMGISLLLIVGDPIVRLAENCAR